MLSLLTAAALAFDPGLIDKVDITVEYSIASSGANDFTFTMDDQDVEVNFELQPGTFVIKVQGWLDGLYNDPSGKAFYGESGSTTIDGTETTPTTISIVVLDQEVFSGANDQSEPLSPIIVSVAVSPSVIRANELATLTFAAVDPNIGEEPGAWSLSMGGTVDRFGHVAGNAGVDVMQCAAGPDCAKSYTAALNDYGNIPFTMTVSDVGTAADDSVSGYVAVDSSGSVVIDASVYHIPQIVDGTVSQDSQVVNYGPTESATVTVPVSDWDLSTGLEVAGDVTLVLSLAESSVSPITEDANGDACVAGSAGCTKGIVCDVNDVTVTPGTPVGQIKTFTLEWKPWDSNTDGATAYGETWCEFTFYAEDSQGLVSQTTTVVLAAIGQSSTGGSFTKVPLFEVIAAETYSPTIGDSVEMLVYMRDPDSSFTLDVAQGALSQTATQSFTKTGCTTQCDQAFVIPLDKVGLTAGSVTVTLTLTDTANPTLQDQRTLTFDVQSARRGRRSTGSRSLARRSEGNTGLSFSIADGKMTVAKAGDWSSSPNPNDSGAASGSTGLGAGIIAGLATGGAVALIAVGVVLRRRATAQKSVDIDMTYDDEMASDNSGVVLSAVV